MAGRQRVITDFFKSQKGTKSPRSSSTISSAIKNSSSSTLSKKDSSDSRSKKSDHSSFKILTFFKVEGSSSASTSSSNSSKYEDRSSLRIPSPAKDHSSGNTKRKPKNFSQKNLFDAIWKGDLKSVELCLENGVKIIAEDSYGRSPLYIAAKHGGVEIVKVVVQNGANINAKCNSGRSVLCTLLLLLEVLRL